jgi:hypothetical protein
MWNAHFHCWIGRLPKDEKNSIEETSFVLRPRNEIRFCVTHGLSVAEDRVRFVHGTNRSFSEIDGSIGGGEFGGGFYTFISSGKDETLGRLRATEWAWHKHNQEPNPRRKGAPRLLVVEVELAVLARMTSVEILGAPHPHLSLRDRYREIVDDGNPVELVYGTVFTNQLREMRFAGGLP